MRFGPTVLRGGRAPRRRDGGLALAAGALLVLGLTVVAVPAWAQEHPPAGQAPAGQAPPAAEEESHIGHCVREAKTDKEAEDCVEAPNPIIPEAAELVWGAITFTALLFLLSKFALPAVRKGMEARAEKIRSSLDEADASRTQAQEILEQYQRQLADAKNEAARIIEEARQAADKLRQDLKRQAEEEMAEVKQRAQDDIAAQASRTMANLRGEVSQLALDLAERVVERSLDRQTNMDLIESFIDQAQSTPVGTPPARNGGNGASGSDGGASGSPRNS